MSVKKQTVIKIASVFALVAAAGALQYSGSGEKLLDDARTYQGEYLNSSFPGASKDIAALRPTTEVAPASLSHYGVKGFEVREETGLFHSRRIILFKLADSDQDNLCFNVTESSNAWGMITTNVVANGCSGKKGVEMNTGLKMEQIHLR